MDNDDFKKLWELIGCYRAGDKRLLDKKLKGAWYLTLKPYNPADVQEAIGAYFRESKHFPDPTDIAARCPEPTLGPEPVQSDCGALEKNRADTLRLLDDVEMGRLMDYDYQAVGIPHPADTGWSTKDWNSRCKAALGGKYAPDTKFEQLRAAAAGGGETGPKIHREAGEGI